MVTTRRSPSGSVREVMARPDERLLVQWRSFGISVPLDVMSAESASTLLDIAARDIAARDIAAHEGRSPRHGALEIRDRRVCDSRSL